MTVVPHPQEPGPQRNHRPLPPIHQPPLKKCSRWAGLMYLLLLPPSIFPSNRVFSNESVLHIRWPKYWSFTGGLPSMGSHRVGHD